MLRLKDYRTSPPGGFAYENKKTGFRYHSWSFGQTVGAWHKEQVENLKLPATAQSSSRDVEQYLCKELLKSPHWQNWVTVTDDYDPNDITDLDSFERDPSSPLSDKAKLVVVFPFCLMDGFSAVKLMGWIKELGPYEAECVLSYDKLTPNTIRDGVRTLAKGCFLLVSECCYEPPRPTDHAPTVAFAAAAHYMMKIGQPWLWLEADAVPMGKGWLDSLQEAYRSCGKAFAGPIVPTLGHMNGTGIYPFNTPHRIPYALSLTQHAWDVMMKREMIGDCYDLHPLFYHAWSVIAGALHPYFGGPVPTFPDQASVSRIDSRAVIFHRNKDLTLIDRLRERKP